MNIKEALEKRRKRKKEEKELIRQMEEEEREIDKELPNDFPMSFKEFIEDMKKEDEDEAEYRSYLTPEELQAELDRAKMNKKYGIIAAVVFSIVIMVTYVGSTIYYNLNKADILKITQPLMEEYYFNRYGEKVKITDIQELTYQEKDKDGKYKTINTGIYLAETDENKHIMSVNNQELGDDISTGNLNNEFIEYMTNSLYATDIITQSVELSYRPYYMEFNRYISYIGSLPAEKTLDEMFQDRTLTATYKLVFQSYVQRDVLKNMMNYLSDDSSIYAIELEVGLPKSVIIIKKGIYYEFPIVNSTQKDKDIYFYQFDLDMNSTSSCEVTEIASSSIESLDEYTFNKGYMFEFEQKKYRSREEKKLPKYFLLRLGNGIINPKSAKQISTSTGGHRELEVDDYDDIIYIEAGGYVYYIGDVDEFLVANNGSKKSFLCKMGICF